MAKKRITKEEVDFIIAGALVAIVLYFIVEPMKELLKQQFPSPMHQMGLGILILLFAAYWYDIKNKKR